MHNLIKNSIKIILFLIPMAAIVVPEQMYFPFITGRGFLFRLGVELSLCLYIALAIWDRNYRPKWDYLLIAFASFVGIIFIADIFAVNPTKAFFSNFERMEGFVLLAHLFAYFLVLVSVFKTRKDWEVMLYSSVAVSVFMTFFAFLQFFGGATINQSNTRLDGTLGNSAYLATYLVFHIFFLIYLWISNGNKLKGIAESVAAGGIVYIVYFLFKVLKEDLFWGKVSGIVFAIAVIAVVKILWLRFGGTFKKFEHIFAAKLYLILILAEIFILYRTATRGAILGFLGGIILSSIIIVIKERENKFLRNIGGLILVSVILIVGLFITFRKSDFVQTNPILNRFANISWSESKTQARGIVWPIAIDAIKENPILGWGQDNFLFAFAKYYRPEMIAHEPWFDRTHNSFLDWFVAGGILGLLGYLSLYIFALVSLIKNKVFNTSQTAIIVGLFSAYAFLSLFIFDNLMSYMLFVIILGLASVKSDEENQRSNTKHRNSYVLLLALVAFITIALVLNLKPYKQNITLTKSLGMQKEGVLKNLELIEKSINLGSMGRFESLEQMTRLALAILPAGQVSENDKRTFGIKTIQNLDLYVAQYPNDIRGYILFGSFLAELGLYEDAIVVLSKAKEFSPKKQQIYYSLAKAYFIKAEAEKNPQVIDEALLILKNAYEFAPQMEGPKEIYENALRATGKAGIVK